jgi:hypothetical protein
MGAPVLGHRGFDSMGPKVSKDGADGLTGEDSGRRFPNNLDLLG